MHGQSRLRWPEPNAVTCRATGASCSAPSPAMGCRSARSSGRSGYRSKAAGQLVDVLVVRGYLDRFPDPGDRRRITVTLTERGAAAAAAARTAIEQVDADLAGRVGAQYVAHARTVLGALMTAAQEHAAHDHRDHDHGDHRSAAGRDGGGEAGGG